MKVVGTRGRLSDQQKNEQMIDIRQRSITPDTHKARIMSDNLQDFDPQQLLYSSRDDILTQFSQEVIQEGHSVEEAKRGESSGLEDTLSKYTTEQTVDYPFYVDTYSHQSLETSRILHFGINTHQQGLREELSIYNEQLRKGLPKTGGLDKISNISGESNYRKFIDAITPTGIENDIVNNAVQYLRETGNKIVLVDLFPRALNSKTEGIPVGTIKLSENIETHTALLYSAGEKILVIDPNNPQFSAFLKNVNPSIIQSSYRADDKIYTRAGESGLESWRDCIDVAVKLAFALNSSENTYLNIESVMTSPEVKCITNNSEIDGSIFYTNPARQKQSSDINKIMSFYQNQQQFFDIYRAKEISLREAYMKEQEELKLRHEHELADLKDKCFNDLLGNCSEYTIEDI